MKEISERTKLEVRVMGSCRANKTLRERLLFPEGRCHSFLMLARDGLPELDLHFNSVTADGELIKAFEQPLNILGTIMNAVGLEQTFQRLAERTRLVGDMLQLKAKVTPHKYKPDKTGLSVFGAVGGPAPYVLDIWNKACALALEINKADILFTIGIDGMRGPATCHAGTRTILKALGSEFSSALNAMENRTGRDLTLETRISDLCWPEPGFLPLQALVDAQVKLQLALDENGRARPRYAVAGKLSPQLVQAG